MKLIFRFSNGSSQLVLMPEDTRDKDYIRLCIDGKPEISIKATKDDSLILEFSASELVCKEEKIYDRLE